MMPELEETKSDSIVMNEVQLILAEKRTSLARMRAGIAVFVLSLSVLSILMATSKYYDVMKIIYFLVAVLAICVCGLILLGSYLVIQSIIGIRHYDRLIFELKREHSRIAEFLD